MKERYEKAEMEVVELESNDIVTASGLIECPRPNELPLITCPLD